MLPLKIVFFFYSSYLGSIRTFPIYADPLQSLFFLTIIRHKSYSNVLICSAFYRASAIAYCKLFLKMLTLTVNSRKSCLYSS